jgi:rare lipoprotein A
LSLLFLAGLLCLAVFAVAATRGSESEPVPRVAGISHSAVEEVPRAPVTLVASYYGRSLAGNPTASGEPYDPEGYTAAHRSLPLGTQLLVSRGGKSVRVTVNDRGPYAPGHDLDLSLAAAREIGLIGPGSAPVLVSVL